MSALPRLAMEMGVMGPFPVVVADPPWLFQSNSDENPGKNARGHYECQPTEDIAAMPIGKLCGPDTSLFLWTTSPMLPDGLHVLQSWGCTYKSQMVWNKTGAFGTGYWNRNVHELVLVGRRGRGLLPANRTTLRSVFDAPVREHSRKPEIFSQIIEEGYPGIQKLDLFARQSRGPLWSPWGDQIALFDIDADIPVAA